jgi:hypothetical protein
MTSGKRNTTQEKIKFNKSYEQLILINYNLNAFD